MILIILTIIGVFMTNAKANLDLNRGELLKNYGNINNLSSIQFRSMYYHYIDAYGSLAWSVIFSISKMCIIQKL